MWSSLTVPVSSRQALSCRVISRSEVLKPPGELSAPRRRRKRCAFTASGSGQTFLPELFGPPVRARRASRPAGPARLLGCLASPRLLASGHHLASPVYPICLHLPGAGVPTRGTSYWGHPLGEPNAPPPPAPMQRPTSRLLSRSHSLPWRHTCLL
jgi:hypothetical protein